MPIPVLALTTDSFPSESAEAAILALPSFDERERLDVPGLKPALEAIGFTGAKNSFARVYAPEVTDKPLAVVGLGAEPDGDDVREAIGAAVRQLTGFGTVAVHVAARVDDAWRLAAEGAALGGYSFDSYKTTDPDKAAKKRRASTVLVHVPGPVDESALATVRAGAEAVALVKDLVSTTADRQSPAQLADAAVTAVEGLGVDVTVYDEAALEEGGFGGILGVGRGSDRPPRLVRLEWAPDGADRHIALVGKGITFDTGGLSLKPAASMLGMNEDMTGAAEVLAVVRAAAQLELPVRVTAWMCIADNMPSGRATRPGDVLTMLDGTTVEVTNTDAEGRLVLADGLVAASRENPDVIVDVATLTGAILVALGTRHTGVMGHGDAVDAFLRSADRTGELAWPLPLPGYIAEQLESRVADMRNADMGNRNGGSMYAGLFLQRFIGRTGDHEDAPRIPWVHLDIAGSAMSTSSAYGFTDKGPTGATTRALIDFVAAGGEVL
ncbi:leucyl aminopeptidase [Microbacterium stercoris]|uniref:Probable cytosol aminopeptidase n=1 Tax=Microbacterium stercoris TaxID=2820289 RepID=A0A939QSR5_9MICO|nr:leucyl aminopeptidase [Microbacterium stercoris]MBO3662501.1 leucyl aminopeptidase [Microbacterium stercoris]MBO3664493.1 leucyl aminopeptidase [Microbacterium stercoris]